MECPDYFSGVKTMAVSKWAGGIVILIAFIVAGKSQAADVSSSLVLEQSNQVVTKTSPRL